MMKRNRGETATMHPNLKEETTTAKSQRRYNNKSPKQHTQNNNAPTKMIKTEEDLYTSPVNEGACIASMEVNLPDNNWDDLSGVWPWAVEQDVLSGWFPFVEGHFREVGEEEGVDLFDLWRLNDIVEVPN